MTNSPTGGPPAGGFSYTKKSYAPDKVTLGDIIEKTVRKTVDEIRKREDELLLSMIEWVTNYANKNDVPLEEAWLAYEKVIKRAREMGKLTGMELDEYKMS